MTKKLKNYKLSCVGVDENDAPARLKFFIYDVEGVEEARNQARKDKYRRKVMGQSGIDFRRVELRAVRCDSNGEVADDDLEKELQIMTAEAVELERLHLEWKYARRSWLLLPEE